MPSLGPNNLTSVEQHDVRKSLSHVNLASTLWNQGQWEEAEQLEVQVMETRKTKLGADHPTRRRA
jgi:hypothetical protein